MYKTFKDMPIWQRAIEISEKIHKITDNLPRKEDYGFTSQVRRSSLSSAANIAEAFGRNHTSDKIYVPRVFNRDTKSFGIWQKSRLY